MPSPPTPLPRTGEGSLAPSVLFGGTLPPGPVRGPARNSIPPGDPYVLYPRVARADTPVSSATSAHAASLRSSRRRASRPGVSPGPTGSESGGPDLGRALKKRASADALSETTPTGIPRRRVTAKVIIAVQMERSIGFFGMGLRLVPKLQLGSPLPRSSASSACWLARRSGASEECVPKQSLGTRQGEEGEARQVARERGSGVSFGRWVLRDPTCSGTRAPRDFHQ